MPFLFPPLSPPRLHRTGRLAPGLVPERLRPGTSCHRHVSNQPGLPMPLKRQQWSWPAESGRMCGWSQRGRIMGCHRTARLQRCQWLGMANSNKVVFINIYIYICIHTNTKKEASIDGGNGKTQQMLKTSFPPQKTWSYISEGRVQPSLYTKCISTHTYSMCTCREIKGNIRWQSKMCIDQRISVHPFKQICTLTHMYRHTH